MSTPKSGAGGGAGGGTGSAGGAVLRETAEKQFAHELAALARADDRERPPRWNLSPWAVVTYLMGGKLADGTVVTPKYVGNRRLIDIAVATLVTDRALLLLGVPGTAKSRVSEHMAAAISGDSTMLVQGRRARPRRRSGTGGNTPCCWPGAPRGRPWCPAPPCAA